MQSRRSSGRRKKRISVERPNDLEDVAAEAIYVGEDPPEGADPADDDDPHIGEDGILTVEPEQLEVECDPGTGDLPPELCFPISFFGWDYTEEREAAARGLETVPPADVTITLQKTWTERSGRIVGLYKVKAEHAS